MGNRLGTWLDLKQIPGPAMTPAGRTVLYAHADGLYVRLPTGSAVNLLAPPVALVETKRAMVDFGPSPRRSGRFTVEDPDIRPNSGLVVSQSGRGALNRPDDETEMDAIFFRATPGKGFMTVYATALEGRVMGPYLLDYLIG